MAIIDKSEVDKVLQNLSELESKTIKAGVLSNADGNIRMIAGVHEFGVDIRVTEKMRGYFREVLGVNLRRDTKYIKIPERSFIRSSFDNKKNEIYKNEELLQEAIEGKITANNFYETVGKQCQATIQNYIVNEVKSPPNSPMTIANKRGKSNPLVDTGRLTNSIDYEITRR